MAVVMPIGKHKSKPLETLPTSFLVWWVSQDNLRFKYWAVAKEALRVLRGRFENFDTLLAELRMDAPPAEYWKTPEQRDKKQEKKRRQAIRDDVLKQYHAHEDAKTRAKQAAEPAAAAPGDRLFDASYFVRQARQLAQRVGDDGSDLV